MLTPRDLLILGFVSRRPTYGHEIKQRILTTHAEEWVKVSQPHIYYVLEKLQKAGYLSSKEERVGNTPPRTVYTITEKGRGALKTMLTSDKFLYENYCFDFYVVLATLGFTMQLSEEESLSIVKRRKKIVERFIASMGNSQEIREARDYYGPIARAIYEHRLKTLRNEQKWLETMISDIHKSGWEAFAKGSGSGHWPSSQKKDAPSKKAGAQQELTPVN